MCIISDYLNYTTKYKNEYGEKTIVLMQVGAFFEVYAYKDENNVLHGSNIEDFASINDFIITQKAKVTYKKYHVMMSGFNMANTDKYIKKLQEANYTIIIITQDIQGKNTTRSVSEIISPGTYFSRESENLTNNSMCIFIEHNKETQYSPENITYGIAIIDIFTGKTIMYQFNSQYYHNPCTYDELERQVAINKPTECIIKSNLSDERLKEIISYVKLDYCKLHIIDNNKEKSINKMAINACKQTYQKEVFEKYFSNLDESIYLDAIQKTHNVAVISFTLLIEFLSQYNPDLTSRLNEPIFGCNNDKLILANHSLKQLNILGENITSKKYDSIGNLLNHCITHMGKRQFMYNLHNPITNSEILNMSYDITDNFLKFNFEHINEYRNLMGNIKDIEKLKRKIICKKITPKDFYILNEDLKNILTICNKIKINKKMYNYCSKKKDPIKECNNLISELNYTFNIEKCLKIDDLNADKLTNFNPEDLDIIKNGIDNNILNDCLDSRLILNAIQKNLSDIIGLKDNKKTETLNVKLHTTNKSDPILLITSRRKTLLKSYIENNSSLINIEYESYDKTLKSIKFDLNDLQFVNYNNKGKEYVVTSRIINNIIEKVQKSIYRLVDNIISFLNNYNIKFLNFIDSLHNISLFITEFDILQCKSYIANKYNLCKPKIDLSKKKSFISFTGLRHLLVEQLNINELYVTNDLTLGTNKKTDGNGILLYGTNAVGKTCLIKSIGISIVMVQSGLYAPCSSFNYFPYNSIFTRILGNDNIFKGLSTFAVEMSELNTILSFADKNSLILGDELCSGTENDSALSIFTAGLEDLHNKESTFLFATHFHEVANFEEIKNLNKLRLMHMTVKYDSKSKKLIYDRKLKEGSGNTMYGLEVCKSLNIPNEFIERAHEIRMKYNKLDKSILMSDGSHYNKKKIKKLCEICKKSIGEEIHHLQHQKHANKNNSYINNFHKDHPANLVNICHDCHVIKHKNNIQHKKVKTTFGYEIQEL